MKTNKKNTKKSNDVPQGFSFADAMYGIKDIAGKYDNFGKEQIPNYEQTYVPQPIKVQKKKQPINKAVLIQKQPIKYGNNKFKQQVPPKREQFKINSGKQFEKAYHQDQLKILKVAEHVYELTSKSKLSQWQYNIFCEGNSLSEIFPQARVSFDFGQEDITQGHLGNCYFISSLASLANVPMVLRQRIPDFKKYSSKDNIFKVNMFESGKYVQIPVDNSFPNIFAKPVGNDVSPLILEKAYAQLYGNYKVLDVGHACDSLRDLTGAPTQYIDIKNKNQFIDKIQIAFMEKYPLVIASKHTVSLKSISPKHSYNILDVQIGANIYLKLRDPRGRSYKNYPQIKQISVQQSENGIFWVDYQTLVTNFEVVTACKVKYGYNYYYKTFKASQLLQKNQAYISMDINKKGPVTLTCYQKHKKFFDDKFKYQMIRIMIAEVQKKSNTFSVVKTLSADFRTQQVAQITVDLTPGNYIIMAKIGTPNNHKIKVQEEALTISVYTPIQSENIKFNAISTNINLQPYILNYMRRNKQQFKESISDQKLYRYFGAFYGYMCMYYQNLSKKSVIEELNYTTQNITIRDTKVSLKPNEQKVIMHPIGDLNKCSHKFAFKTKTIYKS